MLTMGTWVYVSAATSSLRAANYDEQQKCYAVEPALGAVSMDGSAAGAELVDTTLLEVMGGMSLVLEEVVEDGCGVVT